jgi:hypothetical protein
LAATWSAAVVLPTWRGPVIICSSFFFPSRPELISCTIRLSKGYGVVLIISQAFVLIANQSILKYNLPYLAICSIDEYYYSRFRVQGSRFAVHGIRFKIYGTPLGPLVAQQLLGD